MKRISPQKKIVLSYLEKMPPFRERRQKNRGLANLAKMNHPSLKDVPREVMTQIVDEILSQDRAWRWWLEEKNRPDLRGRDYDKKGFKEKKQLEQEAQENLNYESGYNQKILV